MILASQYKVMYNETAVARKVPSLKLAGEIIESNAKLRLVAQM
jgi:hypothetical protein